MLATGDFALKTETGEDQAAQTGVAGSTTQDAVAGKLCNNYVRPAGQVRAASAFDGVPCADGLNGSARSRLGRTEV
jgi:hypothetical protein